MVASSRIPGEGRGPAARHDIAPLVNPLDPGTPGATTTTTTARFAAVAIPQLAPQVVSLAAPGLHSRPEAVADAEAERSRTGRALALGMLAATLFGAAWGANQVYRVVTDAWIAPLHLTPDNDALVQLRLQHRRARDELVRLDAEVSRLDGEIAAIESSIAKLSQLRGSAQATLTWSTEQTGIEASGLATARSLMLQQRNQLIRIQSRQSELVERARKDLAAGVIDRAAVDREEQVADQLGLELIQLDRSLADTEMKRRQNQVALQAMRAGLGRGVAAAPGTMPEIAQGNEHMTRGDVELERLEAEARSDRMLRAAAVDTATAQRGLLAELEARPQYRAMSQATDVAFVPYDQLPDLVVGARVLDCVWTVIYCEEVGRIAEIVPGEVVTQDPWGKLARGQYAVLSLDDKDAVHERVLRARR